MRIDAHQHFWRYSPAEFPWIGTNMQVLARDYLPADLAPALAGSGIDGCIAVQARPDARENEFLLELAATSPLVRGVVGSLVYSTVGLVMFAVAFLIINKAVPFSIRKEIEDDQNTSLGIVIAAVILGIAMIVSAAVHG